MIQANMGTKTSYKKNGSFACSLCSYTSDSRRCFRDHARDIHNKIIGHLECCGTFFSDKTALKVHAIASHHPKYQCTVCDRWYFTSTSLRRHVSVHSHYKEFKSNFSDYATTMKHDVNQHVNQNHNRNDEEEFDYTKKKDKKKYKCKICRRGFQRKSGLRQHMDVHNHKQFKCSLCAYATARKGHLKRHMKTHESTPSHEPVTRSRKPSEISFTDGSDYDQEEDDTVETFIVDRQLRSSSRTTVSIEKGESPHVENKSQFTRIIEEESQDQAQSDSHIDIVEESRESCHRLRQTNARNLGSVRDIKDNSTSSTFYVERLSSQEISSNPSLPVLLDPIQEEARQLRSQISRVTTISTVLSILERLMELSSSITNKIRFFGSDYELRFEAAELFEYVWGISKMAVCRWEEMEGSMSNSNTFLRAVQYAYETLPVFINLEIYEHLEMMEHILILIINTVKNCHAHRQ